MDNDGTRALRPREEAGVLRYEQLTAEQAVAVKRVTTLINALTNNTDVIEEPHGMERAYAKIEPRRLNHVVMIDGSRGSGKSTVMLTLLQAWKAQLSEQKKGMPEGWDVHMDPAAQVVPLSIIDLGALRRSATLILHVADGMRRVVDALIERPDHRKGPVPWSPLEGAQLDSEKRWRQFLSAAAIGWEGNVKDRRARLDPESFVAELDMSVRDWLDVLPAFQAFAKALLEDYGRWARRHGTSRGEPFFVVPIDDADMSPEWTYELLDLIGNLRHPRVAFLVSGDSQLFLATLKVSFAGSLRAPAPDGYLSMEELVRLGVYDQVPALARRYYDKIVPPSHRCLIRPLSEARRVDQLTQFADREEGSPHPLADGIMEICHQQPRARRALPDRMRDIIDLRGWLAQLDPSKPEVWKAQFAERLWQDAVTSEDALTSEETDRIYNMVQVEDERLRNLVKGVALVVRGSSETHPFHYTRLSHPIPLRSPSLETHTLGQSEIKASLYLSSLNEPTAHVLREDGSPFRERLEYRVPLGIRIVGAWILANHLANRELSGSDFVEGAVGTRLESDGPNPWSLEVPWPTPWQEASPQVDILQQKWMEYLNRDVQPGDVAGYARAYLSLVLELLTAGPGNHLEQSPAVAPDDWSSIVEGLLRSSLPDEYRGWARHSAPLIAAPEAGMDADESRRFLVQLKDRLGQDWNSVKRALLVSRKRQLHNLHLPDALTVKELKRELDSAWHSSPHPWSELVEGSGNNPRNIPGDNLQNIPGIGKAKEKALHDMGIRTFKDLAQFDPLVLRSKFGPRAAAWQRLAKRRVESKS